MNSTAYEITVYEIVKKIPLLAQLPTSEINIQKLRGLSNRNFLLNTPRGKYVLRLPKESTRIYINRENEAHNADIAQHLGFAPKVLWQEKRLGQLTGVSLTNYISDIQPSNSSTFNDTQILKEIADQLQILQNCRGIFKGKLDHHVIRKQIRLYFKNCSKKQQEILRPDYQETQFLLKRIELSKRPAVPSHIDFIKGNILIQEKRGWIIDWEYSAMASPFWDIATFCNSVELEDDKAKEFLTMVLTDQQSNDIDGLQQYRKITKTMSNCWKMALKQRTSNKLEI